MMQFRLFLLISVFMVDAWAQSGGVQTAAAQAALDQRRAELRSVLKAPRGREAPQRGQAVETAFLNRHLSAQELADLRQQLRQQRRDARLERP